MFSELEKLKKPFGLKGLILLMLRVHFKSLTIKNRLQPLSITNFKKILPLKQGTNDTKK